jgi:hypothetical protein
MKKIDKENLAKIGDLDYFDGPFTSLFFDKTSSRFFVFNWADVDKIYNKWLIYEIEVSVLSDLIEKRKSYLETIMISQNISLICIDNNIEFYLSKNYSSFEEIETNYLPQSSVYFDEYDSPDYEKIKAFVNEQTVTH